MSQHIINIEDFVSNLTSEKDKINQAHAMLSKVHNVLFDIICEYCIGDLIQCNYKSYHVKFRTYRQRKMVQESFQNIQDTSINRTEDSYEIVNQLTATQQEGDETGGRAFQALEGRLS